MTPRTSSPLAPVVRQEPDQSPQRLEIETAG